MLSIDYNIAVVSYCLDVTDPNGLSMPVACLAIADVQGKRAGVAAGLNASDMPVDRLSKTVLSNVPQLLAHQLDELRDRPRERTREALLDALRSSMRNTLHISKVLPATHIDVASAVEIQPALMRAVLLVLRAELGAAVHEIGTATQRFLQSSGARVAPDFDRMVETPLLSTWPLSDGHGASASA